MLSTTSRIRSVLVPVMAGFLAAGIGALLAPAASAGAADPYRPFTDDSFWNTRLPDDAPRDPDSAEIIDFLRMDNSYNYIRMLGVDNDASKWGKPIFWAKDGDDSYSVRETPLGFELPPELDSLRIPADAQPARTTDSDLVIFDKGRGYVVNMWHASHNPLTDTWSAGAGSVYYLGSNGLHGRWSQSDEPRNYGHRGVPGSIMAVRWDEIQAGRIDHVLELFVHHTACYDVFPMVENECGTTAPFAPPEGTIIRIKPDVKLADLELSPNALVLARALKRYGALIGDQSGQNMTLRVENTIIEGRGQLWTPDVLVAEALERLPLKKFEVIRMGYKR